MMRIARVLAADLGQEGRPGHAGHALVGDDDVDRAALEDREPLRRGAGGDDLVGLAPQAVAQRVEQMRIVVDEEHRLLHRTTSGF
jgi:hypothetical protein